MLQVLFPAEHISFHKEAHIIPIQASLILVILLSCTYYLPLRLKIGFKALWNTVLGFAIHTFFFFFLSRGGVSLIHSQRKKKNTVWITPKLPSVFICQRFKESSADLPLELEPIPDTSQKSSPSQSVKRRGLHTFATSRLGMALFVGT